MTQQDTPTAAWSASLAPRARLDATVSIPGSKSLTNRYLVLAALADGPSTLHGALLSRDTELMVDALRVLGAGFDRHDAQGIWHTRPAQDLLAGRLRGPVKITTGLAGTVMRFVPLLAALADGPVSFDGDVGARARPMGPVVAALRTLGCQVDDDERGTLPLVVHGTGGVTGGVVSVDASGSSQFITGLLLVGAAFRDGVTVEHVGARLPSMPHIDMTVAVLREAGVEVTQPGPTTWHVAPGPVRARDVVVEPDLSNAGPFLAAALAAGGTVRVPRWPSSTTQPGAMMPALLERLGARTSLMNGTLTVTSDGEIHGADLDLSLAGELAPQIAALMALADSPSRLRGIAHLRGHETDRLAALSTEINALGGAATETADGLVIEPRRLRSGTWHTYHDHRMAHAGAIIGLRVAGLAVENIATTAKTLPDFTRMWSSMLESGA